MSKRSVCLLAGREGGGAGGQEVGGEEACGDDGAVSSSVSFCRFALVVREENDVCRYNTNVV